MTEEKLVSVPPETLSLIHELGRRSGGRSKGFQARTFEIKDSQIISSSPLYTSLPPLLTTLSDSSHHLCFIALRWPLSIRTQDGREFTDDKFGVLMHKPRTATHSDNFTYLKGKEELERVAKEAVEKDRKAVDFVVKEIGTGDDEDFEEDEFRRGVEEAFGWDGSS